MRRKRDFYEAAPVPSSIARQDWTHMMERAERSGLTLQTKKGSTGLLFSARILAPILDGGLRHIVLAAIQYSLGRHTYMPGIVAEFTCRNLSRLDEATRSTAVAEIRAHLNRYGEQDPYPRLWHSLSRVLTSGKIKEDDRRKERMPILQPLESMERISRQALADDLDTVLERISRENIGLVITEEGKDDLVLCPASWFNLDYVDDFSCVINSALRYAMRSEDEESAAVVQYLRRHYQLFDEKTLSVAVADLERELNQPIAPLKQPQVWKALRELFRQRMDELKRERLKHSKWTAIKVKTKKAHKN